LLNYRKPELTLCCLQDLLATTGVSLHILLLDNGSGDDSAARLAAAAATARSAVHAVEFLGLGDNRGFAGAMNRGIERAAAIGAPFVLVLNNDVRLPPAALAPLVDVLRNDARAAVVTPTILTPDGRVWAEGGSVGFAPNALRLRRQGRMPTPVDAGPAEVGFATGACLMARTADLVAVGGFDESYFMYWEDVDLCQRLAARGRTVWLPWVRVTHAAGQSSGGGRSALRKFLMANNSLRYLRRAGTLSQWAAFLLFDVLLLPLGLLATPRAAWAKACGILAGLRGHRASAADVGRWLPPS
jgi:GT2 family glycosyltransferase